MGEAQHPAWNKGKRWPPEVKRKISQAMHTVWQNPEHRKRVSDNMKNRTAWNKGKHWSAEIKQKIGQSNTENWKSGKRRPRSRNNSNRSK